MMTSRLLLLAALATLPALAGAQDNRVTVLVTDVQRNPIPFAFVQIENGASRVADDSGRAVFNMKVPDSLRLQVRRMGFNPFIGWSKRPAGENFFLADLIPLPRSLDPVTIAGRRDTPLARTGFYDRLERAQKGAVSARFITPEELDFRNPMRISQVLFGDRMIRMQNHNGRAILMSTRNQMCAMDLLLDGQRLLGTYEEGIGMGPNRPSFSMLQSIDDVLPGHSVAAIEIYGSVAQAPVELQRAVGNSAGCGIVAFWTGSRK